MNKANYHEQMLMQIASVNKQSDSLLLHTCCAPCLTHSLTIMSQYFEDITVYFSNDNITDAEEWRKRYEQVSRLVDLVNDGKYIIQTELPIKLIYKPLDTSNYFDAAAGREGDAEGGQRCNACYNMRIQDSYHRAKILGISYYTSTLTISPHKNSVLINTIGLCYSDNDTRYLCSDFKKNDGYLQSIHLSNQYQIYRQHYCGCPFSNMMGAPND